MFKSATGKTSADSDRMSRTALQNYNSYITGTMKLAVLLAVSMMFNDGREHEIFLLGQTFIVSRNQCVVDYVGSGSQFFVWVNFAKGKKNEAIKKGSYDSLTLCKEKSLVCEKFAVICNL